MQEQHSACFFFKKLNVVWLYLWNMVYSYK